MIALDVACPQCGERLMDGGLRIDAHDSISLWVRSKSGQGALNLSALFGSFRYESGVSVEHGEQVELLCPKCRALLVTPQRCGLCGASMAHLRLDVGGEVFFCTRKGCKGHKVELTDLEASLEMLSRSLIKSE